MKILHIDLKPIGNEYAEFRYFWDNPNVYQPRNLRLSAISGLINQSETDYYTRLPVDYSTTGQALYRWLDGSDRLLQNAIDQHLDEDNGIILAIAASPGLAHLPWEVLHDGKDFLVGRKPAIIPIRWVKDERSKQLTWEEKPADRALNVLLMATAPLGIEPELDFEAEEAQILEATKRQPLCLTVEESGCLQELGCLVQDLPSGYFDIVHLTGHATSNNEQPYFITETEFGTPKYSSAEDIATELQFQLPKLIFLSGCRTGYSSADGTVLSMAEQLLRQGATAVLGWGQNVLDKDAAAASATLYKELSAGMTLTQAVYLTYQALLQHQARDWHLLRLYAKKLPGALVKRGRKPIPRPSVAPQFLDSEQKLRVATRETFVGRRRQLQNCLRILKTSPEQQVGVFIHGMGGLGKSTIAARLCDRLSPNSEVYEIVVLWQQIDEAKIVSEISKKLIKPELREIRQQLQDSTENLYYKLANLFIELSERREKPFLLVLDDFEFNLEHSQGRYILKAEVAEIFRALVSALKINNYHRIIITCRYDFNSELLQSFYKQPLEAFRKSDLQKKLKQLLAFNDERIEQELINRALTLADGNPRLLELLNNDVLSSSDAEKQLSQFEASAAPWKGKITWPELDRQIDQSLEQILSQCLIFEIPVPMSALESVCKSLSGYKEHLNRAIELGLLEVSPERQQSQRLYRVSRILPHIFCDIKLPEDSKIISEMSRQASDYLYQLWGQRENKNHEQWAEIFRLGLAETENQSRFRQQFYQMMEVQYNYEACTMYEATLIKVAGNFREDDLYTQLEEHLKRGEWKEADKATSLIFVYLKILINDDLHYFEKLPCDHLLRINQLWMQYSHNRFGLSIQKNIWLECGGKIDYDTECKLGDRLGWRVNGYWINYDERKYNLEAPPGHLPWTPPLGCGWERGSSLASRVPNCSI